VERIRIGGLDPIVGYTWHDKTLCPSCAAAAASHAYPEAAAAARQMHPDVCPVATPIEFVHLLRSIPAADLEEGHGLSPVDSSLPQAIFTDEETAESPCVRCAALLLHL
jgi:hypothetical protein